MFRVIEKKYIKFYIYFVGKNKENYKHEFASRVILQ